MKKSIAFHLVLLLIVTNNLFAQVSTNFNNTIPVAGKGKFEKAYEQKIDLEIPAKNIEVLLETERIEKLKSLETKPFKIAIPVTVNINLVELINWVPNDKYIYGKYTIKLTSALSASINFDKFYLPNGTEMYVYNENGEMITGVVTENENNKNEIWGSWVYKGEFITVEIKTPAATKDKLVLHSNNVAYGYKEIYKSVKIGGFGQSGVCNINVICPLGVGWEQERNSVSTILSENGGEFCTGSLIMNTCGTNTPYYLTANHCFEPNSNTSGWRFSFQQWSSTCPNPGINVTNGMYNGATLKARNAPSDFCLVELNTTPPINSGLHYAGWNKGVIPAIPTTAIHHPRGDLMKISRANGVVTRTGYGVAGNSHWQANWSLGVTEGGSSGSPLFDQNHRIIGQLHGGPSACGGGQLWDFYGSFDMSWTGGGTPSTRLSDWLDPFNTGVATTNTTNIANLTAPIVLPVISGANRICIGDSGSYAISSVPAGATITWQTTTGAILLVSGQGTASINVTTVAYGLDSIKATITVCGTFYTTPPFRILVNRPPAIGATYTGSNGSSQNLAISSGDDELEIVNSICLGYTGQNVLNVSSYYGSPITFRAISGMSYSGVSPTSISLNLSVGVVGYLEVTSNSSCGVVSQIIAFKLVNCGIPSNPCSNPPKLYNISPNPASG